MPHTPTFVPLGAAATTIATATVTLTMALAPAAPAAASGQSALDTWTLGDGRGVRLFEAADGGTAYSIQRPGGGWTEVRDHDPLIRLRFRTFDPMAAEVVDPGAADGGANDDADFVIPAALESAPDARLRILQLETQWLEDYRRQLEDLGIEVHQPLPATARIVRLTDAQADAAMQLPFVRWIGAYHPMYRADVRLLADFDGQRFRNGAQRMVVRLVDPKADRAAFAAKVAAIGGAVDRLDAGILISEVTVDGDQLATLLAMDEVLSVEPWGAFEEDMDRAREIGGATELESIAGYDGGGVRGEVMDSGFNVNHIDFDSNPLIPHGGFSPSSHGSSTSGIVFGDGTGEANKRGMLPAGQGIIADYDSIGVSGPSRAAHTAELVTEEWRAVFQTCSFGSPRTTNYTSISAEMDAIIFETDLSILQSQSNAGSQNSRPQAWAKNIISVGGVEHQSTVDRSDDRWTGASIGPAEDGRIKPDLTHFYDSIGTVTCCGSTSYTEGFGGTSGATPIVAGYLGLFYDMWADGIFGNEVLPGGDAFENRTSQSTAKAVLINTAVPYDWNAGGPNGNLLRARQGWGLPTAMGIYEQRESMLVVDESEVLQNLQSWTTTFTVLPEEPSLRVTLTWADLPGTTSAALHRVNDLDLKVTAPNGDIYWGNVGLNDGIWSVPGGSRDTINTVENVFVPDPVAGTWTFEVIAAELNEDGHVETPGLDADFALVATGGVPIPPPLVVQMTSQVPDLLAPGEPLEISARITDGLEEVDESTITAFWRAGDEGPFSPLSMSPDANEPDTWGASIVPQTCDPIVFYVAATSLDGTLITSPANAPEVSLRVPIGEIAVPISEDMEVDTGWTVTGSVTSGTWERGTPITGSFPSQDGDGSGACWQTAIANGEDIDGGTTILTSPAYDLTTIESPVLSYLSYFFIFSGSNAALVTQVSFDGGDWIEIDRIEELDTTWTLREFPLGDVAIGAESFRVRFRASDLGADTNVEAAIDGLKLTGAVCTPVTPGDVNADGIVGFDDLLAVLGAFGDCPGGGVPCPEDVDLDGTVGFSDIVLVLGNWTE